MRNLSGSCVDKKLKFTFSQYHSKGTSRIVRVQKGIVSNKKLPYIVITLSMKKILASGVLRQDESNIIWSFHFRGNLSKSTKEKMAQLRSAYFF